MQKVKSILKYILLILVGLALDYALEFVFSEFYIPFISDYSIIITPVICIIIGILVLIFVKHSNYKWVFLISLLIGILIMAWFWWSILSAIPDDWNTLD